MNKQFLDDQIIYDFTLKALFIFNPEAKPQNPKPSESDIQDAKTIYYYPPQANIEEKRIQIGMAEGIFVFFNTFNENNDNQDPQYQVIYLDQQTHIICKIKSDYFIFMSLAHKSNGKILSLQDEYFYSECHKFHYSYNLNMYTTVCQNFINNFKFFYGMNHHQLPLFIPKWINCHSRTGNIMNLMDFYTSAFKYAAVDQSLFLKLQFLLSMIQQIEQNIEDFLVFYNGYFIYSSLPHKIALLIKEHFYGSGLPWTSNEQKVQFKFTLNEESPFAFMNFWNLRNLIKDDLYQPQLIMDKTKYYFTYLERSFLVIMIGNLSVTMQNMNKVALAISKNVEKLSSKLDQFIEVKQDLVKFIYFNGMNLAFKISSQLAIPKLTQDNIRLLTQVYDKLLKINQYILRSNGSWYVGIKIMEKRVIYVLPNTISLVKLDEEISKLTEQSFPNLLL